VEQRQGLPTGMLSSIITHGERSNADQVSEAGARTVAQIIPPTRKAAIEKYGIDAYLSPENALRWPASC
jgi:soluble lytic murein transglycosylase-like protein